VMANRADEKEQDDLYSKNLAFLHEPLQRRIRQIEPEEVRRRVEIVRTREGHPVCRYKRAGTTVRINSTDPVGQAEAWGDQIPLEEIGALFVYGCGFGYPLLEIAKRKPPETVVLLFEPDIYLFIAMLRHFDLEPLFRTQKFAFFVGSYEDFAQEFERLLSTDVFHGCTAPSIAFAPGSRPFKKECLHIHERVFEFFMLQLEKLGNDHYDSLLGFHHIVDNLDEVLKNPYLSCIKDQFKNVPAFIVANGPSLDKAIAELGKAKGKGLILCSESAITPLVKNQIVPDAVFVSERSERSFRRHFDNKRYPEELALIGLAVIDPRIFPAFAGPKIPVFRDSESNSTFFNQIVGDGSALFGGKSSAHFAFEAALYMGADPIVLVGQDLAYGPDGSTHSKQSVYAEAAQKDVVQKLQSLPAVYVESNDGRLIRSNLIWHQFKIMFEEMIARNPQTTVINTTEAGAAIKGTRRGKLASVIETHCASPLPRRLHEVISDNRKALDMKDRNRKRERLRAELEKYRAIYHALGLWTERRKRACERLLDRCETADAGIERELREAYESNLRDFIRFLSPHMHILYFQQVIMAGFYKMNVLGPPGAPWKWSKLFLVHHELFDHLTVVCQSLVRNIGIAIGKLSSGGS